MSHVFVIAEAGISHDGDLRKALTLVDWAKEAGADAVKFQTFNAKALCKRRGKPELDLILKPYEMPLAWLPLLKDHADKVGVEFMTTCFDEETLKVVAPLVKRFKIGHGEKRDEAFYMAHVAYDKPIIASNGEWEAGGKTSFLHCIERYPCPFSAADLAGIQREGCQGYSDHTRNVLTGGFAVAAGAQIVEVHFRDWYTNNDNLDWPVSLCPSDLRSYIELIRQAESAVYGAGSEETKKLERPGSAPHTSHLPASEESDRSGEYPAA